MAEYNFEGQLDLNLEEAKDEPLKLEDLEVTEEEKKQLEFANSSDSAMIETKKVLKAVFLENLKNQKVFAVQVNDIALRVNHNVRLYSENLIKGPEEIVFQRGLLPKIFYVLFGFNVASAVTLIRRIQGNINGKPWVVVFNGTDLGDRKKIIDDASQIENLHAVLWMNPDNYPQLQSMSQAAEALESLTWAFKDQTKELKKKKKIIDEMAEKIKELEELLEKSRINKD